ncbi:TPA: hypothetical protein ACGOWW_002041 [Streptococcus suis]
MNEKQTFATTVNKYAKDVFEKADKKDPASVVAVAELIKAMKGINVSLFVIQSLTKIPVFSNCLIFL